MEELLIKYLFEGKNQIEIAELLQSEGIKPNSLSSVEKALKRIREKYNANTMFHLAVILAKQKKKKSIK